MDMLRGGYMPGMLGNGAGVIPDSPSTGGGTVTARQAVAPPGVYVNTDTTARQFIVAPGVYVNNA